MQIHCWPKWIAIERVLGWIPLPILLSSFKLNFLPPIFISSIFTIFPLILLISLALILRLSWLQRRTTQSPTARGRFSRGLAVEERKRPPLFFLGFGTSLKVCPPISHRAFDRVKFLDASMTFLSLDPCFGIGFFLLGNSPSLWPF
ncbi:hypothetical protein AMTRI_Chr07g27390 [Amborella trichopoda]